LIALGAAFALSVAISLLNRPEEVRYDIPHAFGVRDPTFLPSVQATEGSSMIDGNRISILQNGIEILPAMLEAIASARKSVNLEAYIFWSDDVGTRFRDALSERASHGVEVRVLVDGVGSAKRLSRSDVEILRRSGCRVEFFRPLRPWMLDVINRRTHRRILVVDGKVGFTGGVGLAKMWDGNADSPDHWRDTQVRIEGPAVAEMQSAFQENWAEVTRELLVGEKFFPGLAQVGSVLAAVVPSSPRPSSSACQTLYSVAVSAAEHAISISNSYFVPNAESVALLAAASERGVNVRILVPGAINDVPMTKASGRATFGKLLQAGVKIYEYQPTMMHAKTMVVDGIWTTVGSSNFDERSFRLNDEVNVNIYDAGIAAQMETMFQEDLARSEEIKLRPWLRRPRFSKIKERISGLLKPQL